ncbi:hypothetical protein NP493_425g04018 [Ridgeia piscesae]|uniref:Uncharacterized protein n=1 Tax=Ridgeia piscesae TaxID=27915 RepID=A0AAD9L0P0_RIDPI|nr:hypothetical protein NP493_425g04018 [Ridgeia piscesae]
MSSRITLNRLMALMTLVFGLVLLWRQMLPTSPQLAVARPPLGVEGTTQTPKLGDLPTHPAIPRIIHQTWAEGTIPSQFTPWVRSWMAQNPSWEYWFWTDADIHCFMQHHFPAYLGLYDSYHHNINRADIMRYFVLYTHGGLYADLDMECVRPMDAVVLPHTCVLTEENHAHTYVVQHRASPANVINCLMGCRPGHPYFLDVIRELPVQKVKGNDGNVLDQTGPFLIDRVLRRYLNASSQRPSEDSVSVLPPVYFSMRFDPMQLPYLKKSCVNTTGLSTDAQHVCRHLVDSKFVNVLDPEAVADHHWQHTYWNMPGFMSRPQDSVTDIARLIARHFNTTPTHSTPPTHTCYTPKLKFGPFR